MYHALQYARPDQLIIMISVSGLGGILCLVSLAAGIVRPPRKSIISTQRARYVWVSLAVLFAAIFLYRPLHLYGYAESTGALGEIRARDFSLGWFLTIVFYVQLASPVLAILSAIRIYRKPAAYAKRKRGQYLRTSQVRISRHRRRHHSTNIQPLRSNRS